MLLFVGDSKGLRVAAAEATGVNTTRLSSSNSSSSSSSASSSSSSSS